MPSARELLALAGSELERAVDPTATDVTALAAARRAAELSLRAVLADRGIVAAPDAGPPALGALLGEAGLRPPDGVAALAGIAGSAPLERAEALVAAAAATTWGTASLRPGPA
jgi:hypothetical protein